MLIDWDNYNIAVPAFLTIIMMPFTFSISYGIFFGLGSYFILQVFTQEFWGSINEHFNNQVVIIDEEVQLTGNISVLSSQESVFVSPESFHSSPTSIHSSDMDLASN